MIIGDTGPLVALIDADDRHHHRCIELLPTLSRPLIVTWPCLTEAMYLLYRAGGYPAQDALWRFFESDAARLHLGSDNERIRSRDLMARYREIPMDLADASLVAAAESLNVNHVFTLDSHFFAYQFRDRQPFHVVR